MTNGEKRYEVISYWLEKSKDSLESAELELAHGHLSFAVNRIYYACFYAVSALLLKDGKRFVKHSGVRATFHRDYIKTGQVKREWGKFYNRMFGSRQEGDYLELVVFEAEYVKGALEKAEKFVNELIELINS
jgi:hypothetical protein